MWAKFNIGIWYSAALGSVVLGVMAFQLAGIETARQEVRALMVSLQTRSSQDFKLLSSKAEELPVNMPFADALMETRADAMALIEYMNGGGQPSTARNFRHEEILKDFHRALEVTPNDGYLWARYAYFLDYVSEPGRSETISLALSRAVEWGPKDYNTIRLVIDIGVKRWPWLPCSGRRQVIKMLDHADSIDDHMLARWNTDLRKRPLQQHLEEHYRHYAFNPLWARKSLEQCGSY